LISLRTLAACAALAGSLSAQTWTLLTPATAPGPRRTGGVAWDPIGQRTILHGGLTSGPTASNNETWSFDGASWTQLSPATTPPNRWGHLLVTDTRRNRIVMFGGRSPSLTANANDTWEWNGSDWQLMTPAASPSTRAFYGAAFDARRGRTVIVGAQSTFVGSETWEYDGTTWQQAVTATTLVSRESPSLCYDAGRGVIVLFGGYYAMSPGTMFGETWEYDGVDWTQRTTASTPAPRYRASMVYDEARGRVVLQGGFGAQVFTDTWEYDGVDWTQVSASSLLRPTEAYASFDRTLGKVLHFGGSGPSGNGGDTNVWDGPTSGIFAPYGSGCAGSSGVPLLDAPAAPRLGQNFQVDVLSIAPTALPFLLIGYGNTDWLTLPLPLDLGLLGINGCALQTSIDLALQLPNVAGSASLVAPVPPFVSTLYARIWLQALMFDPQAPNGVAAVSNAAHVVVGS
jgi:hypothetical protein